MSTEILTSILKTNKMLSVRTFAFGLMVGIANFGNFANAQTANSISISGNSGPVISGSQIGRDLNVTYSAWDINRQAVVRPFSKKGDSPELDLGNGESIDLFLDQIRRDKEYSSFLLLFTGSTGRLNVVQALKDLDVAIDKGSASAALFKGILQINGFGAPANVGEGHRLVKLAAERGHPGAQNLLAINYWDGKPDFPKNRTESTKYVEMLANNENAEKSVRGAHAYYLANRYISGEAGKKDVCLGVRTWSVAANLGNVDAIRNLAYERRDFSRCLRIDESAALTWFERGVNLGDSVSALEAGRIYQFGSAGNRDFQAAERRYLAAGSEFSDADHNLGWIYAKGLATPDRTPDYVKAFAYVRRAATGNNSSAMNTLGVMYQYGLGINRNVAEAFRWYGKAADGGATIGRINQAVISINGCVSEEQMPNWFQELVKIAEDTKENKWLRSNAYLNLGNSLSENQIGLPLDSKKALQFYEKGCALGSDRSCSRVVSLKDGRNIAPEVLLSAQRYQADGVVAAGSSCEQSIAVRSKDPDFFP